MWMTYMKDGVEVSMRDELVERGCGQPVDPEDPQNRFYPLEAGSNIHEVRVRQFEVRVWGLSMWCFGAIFLRMANNRSEITFIIIIHSSDPLKVEGPCQNIMHWLVGIRAIMLVF